MTTVTRTTWQDRCAATDAHMAAPQPGDRFTEMYAFWVHVVTVEPEIVVHEFNAPCTVPDDAKPRTFTTVADFQAAYAYGTIPGYWIMYVDNKS